MFMFEFRDIGWWYWLVTVCLLSAGLAGWAPGFQLAIGLTLLQLVHYLWLLRSLSAFPVQVRIGYLLLLLLCYWPPMNPLFWLPTVGTWAQVIFGYCAMARFVSLMPWNLREGFNVGLVTRTFLARPVRGNIMQGHAPRPVSDDAAEAVDVS
jgi:hypothetical protein